MAIRGFNEEYAFLSNFYPCIIAFNGLEFQNSEAAFQSMKCEDSSVSPQFQTLTPREAKTLGRKIQLRSDWEDIKVQVMYDVVYNKFTQNAGLRLKLLATGEQDLIEENWWKDRYWGTTNGYGENYLGKILMLLREELKCMKYE